MSAAAAQEGARFGPEGAAVNTTGRGFSGGPRGANLFTKRGPPGEKEKKEVEADSEKQRDFPSART